MRRAYKVVDAFSAVPLLGNPVAVVLDADELDDRQMQAIARWTNLSETTFVLPATGPDAAYRLRIFTPRSELPFAGHPTLGSAHAMLEAGRVAPRDGALVQECGVGLVRIAVRGQSLSLELPRATVATLDPEDVAEVEAVVGHPVRRDPAPAVVAVGVAWIVAQLPSVDVLLGVRPDLARSAALERRLGVAGLSLFAERTGGADVEVRSFAPSCGVDEDPVCGSGNGSIAAFRWARGRLPAGGARYVATQGRCVGRDGRVSLVVDREGSIEVGGDCVTVVDGVLSVASAPS